MELRSLGSLYPSWWGFLLAYLLSAVVESPLLWVALRRDGFRYRTAFKFSFLANAASYAFLAVVVLALIAIPIYRLDPTGLRKELRGQIFVYHFRHSLTRVGDLPSCRAEPIVTDEQPYTHGFFGSASGRMFLMEDELQAWELHRNANRWQVDSQPAALPGRLLAVGNDGETLVCGVTNHVVLVSKQGVQQQVYAIAGVPLRAALSYDGRYLAYSAGDFNWFGMEAIDASGRPTAGTRYTTPPQFLQDYGDLQVLALRERSLTDLGRVHGNQFGFHPNRNLLAYAGDENIEVLNLESKAHTTMHVDSPIRIISNLAWSPDGKYLAFMQYRGPHFLISRGFGVSLWVATPDGSRLAPLPVAFTTSGFHLWNVVWRND
jgi:hypothetical protein